MSVAVLGARITNQQKREISVRDIESGQHEVYKKTSCALCGQIHAPFDKQIISILNDAYEIVHFDYFHIMELTKDGLKSFFPKSLTHRSDNFDLIKFLADTRKIISLKPRPVLETPLRTGTSLDQYSIDYLTVHWKLRRLLLKLGLKEEADYFRLDGSYEIWVEDYLEQKKFQKTEE